MNIYDHIRQDIINLRDKYGNDLQTNVPEIVRSPVAIDVDNLILHVIDELEYASTKHDELEADDRDLMGAG